jgi:methyl-accepting chemotaxis protein
MSIIKYFLRSDDVVSLDIATGKRLSYLVWLNLILIAFFPMMGLIKFLSNPTAYRFFFVAICAVDVFFAVSLAMIKSGRFAAASYLVLVGMLAEISCLFFLTSFAVWGDIYRVGVFLMGAITVEALVALNRRQVLMFLTGGLALYAILVFFVAAPLLGGIKGEGITTSVLFLILYLTVGLVVMLTNDLNTRLVALAKSEGEENMRRAEGLHAIIGSVKGALDTGRELAAAAGEGRRRSGEIRSRLGSLRDEADGLRKQSVTVDADSVAALARVNSAKTAVDNQNIVIVDVGAAVQRISATIRDISSLAVERRGSISSVVSLVERQGEEIKGLIGGIERIRSSSAAVMAAAGGILDISEKTNLLAMNASIEAAHAGSSGKGFAVISSEIRKLSQETQESTKRIGAAIRDNDATINAQAEVMARFTAGMDGMIADVKSTIDTLGAMLDDLGKIGIVTSGLGESTASILKLAGETKQSVLGVGEGLQSGARSASEAKEFATKLSGEVGTILEAFAVMDAAVEKAAVVGDASLARVAQIDAGMAALGGDPAGSPKNA